MEARRTIFNVILILLAFIVPVLVLPMNLDNAFNTPKTALALIGTSAMAAFYVSRLLRGQEILVSGTAVTKILLVLVALNLFSFFYTANPYYTNQAVTVNLIALAIFYFSSLYLTPGSGCLVLLAVAFSGVLVSVETYLQFYGIFVLFKWARPGIMVMGTIGNSNYLGAYLIFPLFTLAGLVLLLRGKLRIVPIILFVFVLGALLFTRARAGWLGFFLSLPLFLFLVKRICRFRLRAFLKTRALSCAVWGLVSLAILLTLWFIAPQKFHVMMGFGNVTNPLSLKLRMQKYSKASFWLFKQNPLFGTGLWSYRNQVFDAQARINQAEPGFFKDYPEPKPESVHNEYLEVLNDGGVVAASVIALFLLVLFQHAWKFVSDEKADLDSRIMAASAWCAVIAILLAALFSFPFRINTTLFMTALMMGLIECLYLQRHGLLSARKGQSPGARSVLILPVVLFLAGIVWYQGIRPLKGEMEYFRYKKALERGKALAAEKHLLRAIDLDPHNTVYNFFACQFYMNVLGNFGKANDFIEKATHDYNGDIIRWSIFHVKGLLKLQAGSLFEARAAFEKALYYNPEFTEARQRLEEVNKVIREHDRVLIRFK